MNSDVYVDGVTYTDAIGFGTVSMTLPTADGSNGQVLTTNGSGALAWSSNIGNGPANINAMSDALVEDNSIYIGNDPSSSSNSAQYNVGVGIDVLNAITTGDNNTAVGFYSLDANTTGEKNTAVGGATLTDNTSGKENTAIGYDALTRNTRRLQYCFRMTALMDNVTADFNTGLGYNALTNNTT